MVLKTIVIAVREVEPNSVGVPPMTMRHVVAQYEREVDADERSALRKQFIHNDVDYLEYEIHK